MMQSGSVMASWDLWMDPIWPHTTGVSKWQVTDHVYCLVNSSQYLQVELIVGYVLKSAIFGLVRALECLVGVQPGTWLMSCLSKV